jgi:hypothetical protein
MLYTDGFFAMQAQIRHYFSLIESEIAGKLREFRARSKRKPEPKVRVEQTSCRGSVTRRCAIGASSNRRCPPCGGDREMSPARHPPPQRPP